jgi:periplasmic divalent cation tolerance protein
MEKNSQPTSYGVVLVTAESRVLAEAIALALVESHLAACVSLIPTHSIYSWQGKIHSEEQWQLIIKTDLAKFSLLETKIKAMHSDEVPEILALPVVDGFQPYLQWISEQVPD